MLEDEVACLQLLWCVNRSEGIVGQLFQVAHVLDLGSVARSEQLGSMVTV